MNKNSSLHIADKQFEARRKQWEALYEKYRKRAKINTAECYFSDINCKMFIKPLKANFKARKNKTYRGKKGIVLDNERVNYNHNINEPGGDSESSVSSTVESVNFDETDAVDSGIDMSDRTEEILKTENDHSIQFVDIHISQIIDEDIDCSEVNSTVKDHLHKLISFIEVDLKSNLKAILKRRIVSKLLQSDDFSYWHKCTKEEMTRLEKYISSRDLKEYMRYCNNADFPENINIHAVEEVIVNKMQSNIKTLFLKREFSKDNTNKYMKYRRQIFLEWQRLSEAAPIEYLILYGIKVLCSVDKLKKTSLSNKKLSSNLNPI